MFDRDFLNGLWKEVKNLYPLFRYLVLQTETHAFCLALSAAALLAFFPSCLVILAVLKFSMKWDSAYNVFLDAVRIYFPTSQFLVVRNLDIWAKEFAGSQWSSLLWVLLGAAGVFIPLETGFNRLWQVREDRPYWMNQVVGFTLTIVCAALALAFVGVSTVLHWVIDHMPFEIVRTVSHFIVIRITITSLFVAMIFAVYKYLPNRKIRTEQVLPAAILAGIVAELVRIVFAASLYFVNFQPTHGPFSISVTFLLLAYFETFVLLGGAFLAAQAERYPWMGFLQSKRSHEATIAEKPVKPPAT